MTANEIGSRSQEDIITRLFYPIYDRFLNNPDSEFVENIEENLAAARYKTNVEMYLSKSIGIGVILATVLFVVGAIIGIVIIPSLSVGITNYLDNQTVVSILQAVQGTLTGLLVGLILSIVGFVSTFSYRVIMPQIKSNSREREINKLMPDALSFMYSLSVGGMNQLEIIEAMARSEETYGAVSQEFQSIVRETQYFETDYRNAIERQARETPSEEFSQFLRDMLSILSSGGDVEKFLEEKKDKSIQESKERQERTLETLDLFGEMYMVLSIFPLLLIVVLVAMSLLGSAPLSTIYAVVYGLLPILGVAFLVIISTVRQDEIGSGILTLEDGTVPRENRNVVVETGIVSDYQGDYKIFDYIREGEDTYNTIELLKKPHVFFRDNPLYILTLTVPATISILAISMASGFVPLSWSSMVRQRVWGTFMYIYVPLYLNLIPLAIFYEWNQRNRYGVVNQLSETLRKLSSANDTGQTLFEAMETVAESSRGKLSVELDVMASKIKYGTKVDKALIEFNNKYRIPRLSRTIKVISKSQQASNQISDVLTAAAQASENQDKIKRSQVSQARMQVVIIATTFLTMLFVFAVIRSQFISIIGELGEASEGGGEEVEAPSSSQINVDINPLEMSLMFFHAVTIQAILGGLISGYMRDGKLLSGLKYVIIFATFSLAVWAVIG